MQRRGSRTNGREKAWVGQASRQRVHAPQRSLMGASAVSERLVTTSPSRTNDPSPGTISIPFFPMKPSPARAAQARSRSGASSTRGRACTGASGVPRRAEERRELAELLARAVVVVTTAGVTGDVPGERGVLRFLGEGALVAPRDAYDEILPPRESPRCQPALAPRRFGEVGHLAVHPLSKEGPVPAKSSSSGTSARATPPRRSRARARNHGRGRRGLHVRRAF